VAFLCSEEARNDGAVLLSLGLNGQNVLAVDQAEWADMSLDVPIADHDGNEVEKVKVAHFERTPIGDALKKSRDFTKRGSLRTDTILTWYTSTGQLQ
jgi:hypothetical protein